MDAIGISPRRLGSALLVFGGVGAALALIGSLVLLLSVSSTAGLGDRLEGSRTQLVEALGRAEMSIGHAADTTEHIGATLDSTQALLASSSQTLTGVADASDALGSALIAVSILGSQPLATAGRQFQALAGQVRTYADHATQLSTDLRQNVADMSTTADDLRQLQANLRSTADRLDGLDLGALTRSLLLGQVLLLAITGWLACGALGCAWLGYRVRAGAAWRPATGTPRT